jgi:tetratricopeptide (TPR) repeat protein
MNNNSKVFLSIVVIALAVLALTHHHHKHAAVETTPVADSDADHVADAVAEKEKSLPIVIPPMPTIAGSYLSARFAIASEDLAAANKYYQQALDLSDSDKEKGFFYERALPAALGAGDLQNAIEFSKKIDLNSPTATGQLAVLTLIVDGFKQNDPDKVAKLLPQLRTDGFGRLLKPLLETWNAAGKKDYATASLTLQKLKKDYPSLQPLVQMHMAFLYDVQDDKKDAETYYKTSLTDNLSIRSAYIISQFYERQGKTDELKALYQILASKMPDASLPHIVLQRIDQGKLNKKPFIEKPSDGVAAALYDVATVLHQENSSRLAILYAQMAHYLAPDDSFTKLLLSDILSTDQVKTPAIDYLKTVSKDDDLFVLAQMRLAQIYEADDLYDQAIAVLQQFMDNPLVKPQAIVEMADLYRRKEDYPKAIPLYTQAIEARPQLTANDWALLYSRGICYERNNQWDKAEADLTQALKLNPQQPEVLNYLAYSWADHGTHMKEAIGMLQKALASAPDDPYITDSYGWALYKNGQTKEAVPYLEAAVQALPADAVINGHLGDIYWKVGRHLEARFQWERALKNTKDTDTDLRKEYNEKLEKGLPDDKSPAPVPTTDKPVDDKKESDKK